MRKIVLIIIVFLLAASIGYCQDQPLQQPDKSSPLTLTIKADKDAYRVGEKIVLTALLENKSQKEMIVFWDNKAVYLSLAINSINGAIGSLVIHMPIDSNSKSIKTIYIKPNDVFKDTITLGNDLKPARYEVVLEYKINFMALNFKHLPTQEIWGNNLTSNIITIEVVEKRGITKKEALSIAKKVCQESGWKWKNVSISENQDRWLIVTRIGSRHIISSNTHIEIDKNTGEVIKKLYFK